MTTYIQTYPTRFSNDISRDIMILDKIIKPKWQHRNPEVRKQAVEDLTDLTLISDIARKDESPLVRLTAVRKLKDLTLLNEIAQTDTDKEVKEFVSQRFKDFLSGRKEGIDLPTRLQWVTQLNDSNLLEQLARTGKEAELRLAALNKVTRESLCGDLAIEDPDNQVRTTAAEKITQKSTLERVFKALRNKDKKISQLMRERLDVLIEASERPAKIKAEAERICSRLELLLKAKAWEQPNDTEFKRLQVDWTTIATEAEPTYINRYQQAEQLFTKNFQSYQQTQAELREREAAFIPLREVKQTLYDQLVALLTSLEADPATTDVTQTLDSLQMQWDAITSLPQAEEEQWQNRFKQALTTAQKYQQTAQTFHSVTQALERILRRAENLLKNQQDTQKAQHTKELESAWEAVTQPENKPELLKTLNIRFNDTVKALKTSMEEQNEHREQAVKTLKQILKDIETALETGELHTAMPLEQQAKDLAQQHPGLLNRNKNLEARLHGISAKIRELHSWERWGDNVEREQLCAEMEELAINPDDDPEVTARLIREAQAKWKSLGTHGYPQALWERFNKACNTAYKPCQEHFEVQAKEREKNYQQKQTLCDQLETFAAQIDWHNPDWKQIYNTIRDIDKAWRQLGPTNRKARKIISTRYEKMMGNIEKYLDEERKDNQKQREQLIEKVKATQTYDDVEKAINEVKGLQAEWHVSVPGSRGRERQLWKAFRSACDIVFERRKEKQDAFKKELQTHYDAKVAVCEKIEALTQLDGEAFKDAVGQLKKLQKEWHDVGEVPKKQKDTLDDRYKKVCKQLEQKYQAHLVLEKRAQLQLLRQKAALCIQLERAEIIDIDSQIADAQNQWAALATLENMQLEQSITIRFATANDMVKTGEQVYNPAVLQAQSVLCLRLEILAGVPSPPEAAEARMAYQVARLSQVMSGEAQARTDKFAEVQEIERAWHLSGATAGDDALKLEQRFYHALESFYAS
ncbi:DUF349 domain-containing protein [Beggiatoa leptomitoformis]|uniref:DUF349 domain-containing protein n=1 Tax=Beggiatoa leptomitoformis TaxID=288004 RepID=A0A2N9YAY9_9GAMM|nr:DUF349 domain-containing protein [Beggiatoa leptomitoformis]ALG67023.2 DUF349 domain-containing protein [Beggiatoa leptomitoformis]AUI67599.2 DUF349 domain-containing protein [Beggiatoa leptomitoformis]